MDAHDSEFKEFLVPVAVGLPFHGFDIVIGALHRTWRNGMIVPSQDAEPEFSHGISNLHQWANLWHSCKGIQWEQKSLPASASASWNWALRRPWTDWRRHRPCLWENSEPFYDRAWGGLGLPQWLLGGEIVPVPCGVDIAYPSSWGRSGIRICVSPTCFSTPLPESYASVVGSISSMINKDICKVVVFAKSFSHNNNLKPTFL